MDITNKFTVRTIPYGYIDGVLHVLEHERVHCMYNTKPITLQDRGYSKGYFIAGQYQTLQQIEKIVKQQNP